MSPRSKKEYQEAVHLRYKNATPVVKKPLSWMNSVLPMDVTANMPSESSKSKTPSKTKGKNKRKTNYLSE
ncbi:MAG: hypothetical protein OS130_01300 [Thermodesulfobacteriota bacterium]|nr:MAG: hypothetical protein OS130_01300 [Thermodesulfobacteriota bacterium]